MNYKAIRQKILPVILWLLVTWLGLRFLGPILLPFAAGLLLALAAEPLVNRLQQQLKLPRWAAAGISVTGLYLFLILLLALACRLLWQELTAFFRSLPSLLASVSDWANLLEQRLLTLVQRLPDGMAQLLTQTIRDTLQNTSGLAEKLYDWLLPVLSGLLKGIPTLVLFLLTAVLSSFMLAAELPKLKNLWKSKAPDPWQERSRSLLLRFKNTLGGWIKAQLKLMCISALVLTAGFLILKIDYPLLFGMVIALIDALPALGTGLILIPWAMFLYLQGNTFLGTGLLLLYGTAALIRTALEPRLLGKQMGLDPLLTLLALYSGYRFLGIWGMILFPISAIMVKQFWNHMENPPAD